MWGLLTTATAPARALVNQFLRNQAAAAVRKSGLGTLRTLRQDAGLQSELAALKLATNVPAIQGVLAGTAGLTGVDISNRTGLTGQIEGALNKVGPKLDQLFSGTPQVVQQFGREQEKKGWGGALEMATPFGFLAAPFIPKSQAASIGTPLERAKVGDPMYLGGKLGYKGADGQWHQRGEMLEGDILSTLPDGPTGRTPVDNTSGSFATSSPAIERSYQQEKARATQLSEQDQLTKKYRVADLTKAYNTAATPEEKERIGLEIWATTNPRLAQKLQPGQVGYEQAQSVAASQGLLGSIQPAGNISFGDVPATPFTPTVNMGVTNIPSLGSVPTFKAQAPSKVSFAEATELFKPETLSQTQQAILKRAFEQGFKK